MRTIKLIITAIALISLSVLTSCEGDPNWCPGCVCEEAEQNDILGSYIYTDKTTTQEIILYTDGTVESIFTTQWGTQVLNGTYIYAHPKIVCSFINEDPTLENSTRYFIMADDQNSFEVMNNPGWIFDKK